MKSSRLVFILFFVACAPIKEESGYKNTKQTKYAKGFHFELKEGEKRLVVDEPWPKAKKPIVYILKKPIDRLVVTSTSHLPYIEMLGAADRVVGFPNLKYISSETFIKRGEEGLLTDLGPDGKINMELLLGVNPDAVVAFDMGGESQVLDKIEEAGIPVFYNSDFLEQSPLGRAEWIKFFGALLDKEKIADSIFMAIEKEYLRLNELASSAKNKPTILSGVVYGDTWFLPGGNNWAATFYRNAGGEYVWDADTTSGWLELSFEAVYEKAHNADMWIGTSTLNSRQEMLSQEGRYASFEAFENGQVYNYSKKIGPNGGYDFFESGYSRPDLVLGDLIKILHPELLPEYETVYFEKLP
ncbi:ABC transporter substrate-binding protein [Ekhidna sp.]|jgi:iron complex transport system substrate-binding protein|uniref:ABC transporter substrate-binding protein n=1 Tax=Ekhidna sp. TaxID=2608089 RepID=UPI0032EBD57D